MRSATTNKSSTSIKNAAPDLKLQAVFTIPDADRSFERLFAPELADVSAAYNPARATVSVTKQKNRNETKKNTTNTTINTIITVNAADATALRAMVNGITKVLAIQKKMDDIK